MVMDVVVHRLFATSLWVTWHLVGARSSGDVVWLLCS